MIEIRGLEKHFGDHVALQPLDLQVEPGELFCFLGPNGAGKTTTIKLLTGLLHPTHGTASIGGHDIRTDALGAKALLGYIPDRPYLYEKLTGRELLRFVAGLYRLDARTCAERTEALLAQYELDRVADRLIETYSHGMRQKLSFAACFLHAPRAVVVDEPWVGLDPKNIHAIKHDLKRRTRTEGLTVFMSTHTLSIAEELADRIGIIHRGRLLHLGTVAEVKALASGSASLEDVFLELTQDQPPEPVA